MRSRIAVAIVLLAALAGAGYLARGGEGALQPLTGSASESLVLAEQAPGSESAPTAASAAGPERAAVHAEPASAAATDWIRVRVVDDATGQPVAGAELVGFIEEPRRSEAEDHREGTLGYRGEGSDLAALARARGRVTATAADGTAVVPLGRERTEPWAGAWLEAQAPGRFGRRSASWSEWQALRESGVELRIRPSRRLQVEVVDAAGVPVRGVTVLHLATTEAPDREPLRLRSVTALGRTDAVGRVEAAHFEVLVDDLQRDAARLVESAVTVRLCGAEALPVPLPLDPLAVGPVRVSLPPTGALRVELPTGTLRADWQLALRTEPLPAGDGPFELPVARALHTELLGPGDELRDGNVDVLAIPQVAVGCTLRATLTEWNNVALIDEAFAGPTRPGEIVTLRLELAAPVLCGRFVDGDGRAVVAQFDVQTDAGLQRFYELRSGNDGRFRLPVEAALVGVSETTWDLVGRSRSGTPMIAGFELPGRLRAGEIDVGEVVVEELPILVTGRCVDDAGAPVERPSIAAIPVDPAPGRLRPSPVELQRRASVDVRTDGTFSVRGSFDGAELRLSAGTRRHLMPEGPVVVRVGSRDVELVLARASGLVATAVGLRDAHDLIARLVADDGRVVEAGWYAAEDEVMTWKWSRIPAARYRFELLFGPTSELLASVDDVVLEPDTQLRDPRLQGLRIPSIETFRLRAVALDGAALRPDFDDWAHDHGLHLFFPVGDAWHGRSMPGVTETFVNAPPPPLRLLVVAPGHRPAFATWTGGELTVPMARAPKVVVRLPDDASIDSVALRGGPTLRLVTCGPSDLGALDRWPGMTARPPSGAAVRFEVPEPGRYAIELTGPDAGVLAPSSVDVGAGETATEITLRRR